MKGVNFLDLCLLRIFLSPSLCLESEEYIQMSPYEEVKGIAKSNFKNGIRFLMSFGQRIRYWGGRGVCGVQLVRDR